MKKLLIVSGCSITHGCDTVQGFMHPENIKHSYSYHLSQWLDCDLENLALSGGSNEHIFHSLIDRLDRCDSDNIHSVIAAWTSTNRLHWVNKGRHWFFIPGWASSMQDLYDWEYHEHADSQTRMTGDSEEIVELLKQQHRFFIDNYLDDSHYLMQKLRHYKSALQAYCDHHKIMLINLDIFQEWPEPRHPNIQEHINLAKRFHEKFYSI